MSPIYFLYFIMFGFSVELLFGKRTPEQNAIYALVVVLAAAMAVLAERGAA